jgi:hypothetical protein
MANAPSPSPTPPEGTLPPSLWGGFLSYLVPGLGQVYQGRVGKGLLFLVSIYGLFFTGMYLGTREQVRVNDKVYRITSNVYLPDTADQNNPWKLSWRLAANLYNRPQFLAQFWTGIVAWPAIIQYINYDPNADSGPLFGTFMREPPETTINMLQTAGDKRWDLGWVYTVIAGVLNVMVIYDAFAGPAFGAAGAGRTREAEVKHAKPSPAVGA